MSKKLKRQILSIPKFSKPFPHVRPCLCLKEWSQDEFPYQQSWKYASHYEQLMVYMHDPIFITGRHEWQAKELEANTRELGLCSHFMQRVSLEYLCAFVQELICENQRYLLEKKIFYPVTFYMWFYYDPREAGGRAFLCYDFISGSDVKLPFGAGVYVRQQPRLDTFMRKFLRHKAKEYDSKQFYVITRVLNAEYVGKDLEVPTNEYLKQWYKQIKNMRKKTILLALFFYAMFTSCSEIDLYHKMQFTRSKVDERVAKKVKNTDAGLIRALTIFKQLPPNLQKNLLKFLDGSHTEYVSQILETPFYFNFCDFLGDIRAITYSCEDDAIVAAGSGPSSCCKSYFDLRIYRWNRKTGKLEQRLIIDGPPHIESIAVIEQGKLIACRYNRFLGSGLVSIINAKTGKGETKVGSMVNGRLVVNGQIIDFDDMASNLWSYSSEKFQTVFAGVKFGNPSENKLKIKIVPGNFRLALHVYENEADILKREYEKSK